MKKFGSTLIALLPVMLVASTCRGYFMSSVVETASSRAPILVMQAVQHRQADKLARYWLSRPPRRPTGHMLADPLVRS
jgi:hypothetical protein